LKIVCTVSNDLSFDQRMIKICSALSNAGHRVLLAGRELSQSIPIEIKDFDQERFRCFFNKGPLFYLELNIRHFYLLLRKKPDLIYAVDDDTLLASTLASKLLKAHLVFDSHEYFSEVPELEGRNTVKSIWRFIEKMCIPAVDLCITVNQSIANLYTERYKKDFEVVRNLPDLAEKQFGDAPDPYILYQGALNKGRGLELLIEVICALPYKLKIAGDGDIKAELQELVKQYGIFDRVEFLGRLTPEELLEVTSKAYIGYNLMEPASLNYYYSLSNKFFDYMMSGVPSLNNKFPEYERILEKDKIGLALDFNKDALSLSLRKLMTDQEFHHELVNNCKKARERYNWQREKMHLLELFDKFEK